MCISNVHNPPHTAEDARRWLEQAITLAVTWCERCEHLFLARASSLSEGVCPCCGTWPAGAPLAIYKERDGEITTVPGTRP